MTARRTIRFIDLAAVLLLIWTGLALVPATWFWFQPGPVVVSDSVGGAAPVLGFERTIKRSVQMSYQVTIRKMRSKSPVCDPQRGPFTYRPDAELPDPIDLVWWSGADVRCWPQEPGTYIAETCWTVVSPFYGLVPPKTVCRESNPFTVHPH